MPTEEFREKTKMATETTATHRARTAFAAECFAPLMLYFKRNFKKFKTCLR